MSRSSRSVETPVSLFSFQDIITCLSGIMIFLVLMLALQITVRLSTALEDVAMPEDMTATLDDMRQQAAQLKQQVEEVEETSVVESQQQPLETARKQVELEQQYHQLSKKQMQLDRKLNEQETQNESLSDEVSSRKDEMAKAEKEIKEIEAGIDQIKKDPRVYFIPEKGADKSPVLIECSGSGIRVGELNASDRPRIFTPDSNGKMAFMNYIKKYSKDRQYFVFMLKPSSEEYAMLLIAHAKNAGYDVGYDALEEDRVVGFGDNS